MRKGVRDLETISRRAFVEGAIVAGAGAFAMAQGLGTAFASTPHFNDGSVVGASAGWDEWTAQWADLAADYTKVSIAPGKDETMLNFAWLTPVVEGQDPTPVVMGGLDQNDLQEFDGVAGDVDTTYTDGVAYVYNHVMVSGIDENTTYYYAIVKNGVQGDICTCKTNSFETVKIAVVGDPQIGASKGQTQGGAELVNDAGAANTAACNDAFGWSRTLSIMSEQNPDLNFIISAGDQVNKTGEPKEEEYAGFLSAPVLASVPLASAIGNHDSLNPDYSYHFYTPNALTYGRTAAGGDYFYAYGDALFIVLNTNCYSVAEHEAAVKEAVAAYPDKTWRIVTIHQDIYGTGADHSATDGMILRTQLTPICDAYDIDVLLQGHDHTYSRSFHVSGDGKKHDSYEFLMNADGTDYDWDHAHDKTTDALIPLAPEDGDADGQKLLAAFQQDNLCYAINPTDGDSVTDPEGTLFIAANSASGSKYYELIADQQDYVVNRSQNWLPSYSIITLDSTSFTVQSFQIADDGSVDSLDTPFTIYKTA